MATKRDVEILLRGTDLASKPLGDVAAAVQKLATKLTEQESAAAKGEATTRELATTLNQLNDAAKALAGQNAAVERYRDLTAQLAAAREKAATAATALNGLTVAVAGNAAATKTQTTALAKAQAAADRLDAAVLKRTKAVEQQTVVLTQAGIDTQDLAAAEATLVAAMTATGQARTRATAALDGYDAKLRAHRAEVKATADATKAAAASSAASTAAEALQVKATTEGYQRAWATALASRAAREKEAATQRAAREKASAATATFGLEQAALAEAGLAAKAAALRQGRAAAEAADALRVKAAAQDYQRFWVAALDARDAREKTVAAGLQQQAAGLQQQAAAFRANRDAIQSAFRATIGYTAAQDTLIKKQINARSQPGFLGLRPYELQNLSFQINDIFTQLASGASLTQTLSQQGGQIFQLFQSRLVGLAAALPAIVAVATTLGVTAAALVRLSNTIQSVREFSAQLALSADGTRNNAEEIVKLQRRLQALGLGFDDAGKSLRTFIEAGIGPARLEAFAKTAFKLSEVTGKDLKDAVADLTAGFTGNFESIEKLDKKYNIFSATQLKTIKDAYEELGIIEARSRAFAILEQSADKAATLLKGPLATAFREARIAWFGLLDAIGNSAVGRILFQSLTNLAVLIQVSADALKGAVDLVAGGPVTFDSRLAFERAELAGLIKDREFEEKRNTRLKLAPPPEVARRRDTAIAIREVEIDRLERLKAANAAKTAAEQAADADAATQAQKKAGDSFLSSQKKAFEIAKGVNNERRITIAGQKAESDALAAGTDIESAKTARVRARVEEGRKIGEELKGQADALEQQLAQITAAGDKTQRESLDARLKAIDETYKNVAVKLAEFRRVGGGSIGGLPLDEFQKRIEAQKELLKQNETLKFFEENITDLAKARENVFKDINDAVASNNKTAAAGYVEAKAVADDLNPKIAKLSEDALRFARALAEVRPGPQLLSFIAQMERAARQAGDGGRTALGANTETQAKEQLGAVNAKLQERAAIETAWQNLVARGVVSQTEASSQIRAAYTDINVELADLVVQFDNFLRVASSTLPAAQLELLRAKLVEFRTEVKVLDPATKRLKDQIDGVVATAGSTGIDKMAQSIGGAIAGTKSLGDAWQEVGNAALMAVADILQGIAKIIIQKQILAAISTVTGLVFHAGAVVGQGGMSRTGISPSLFVGAPRYHTGRAGVGLPANEVPAILLRGEEVLSRDDPRNVMNGFKNFRGGEKSGGAGAGIRQVLVLDHKQIPAAMSSSGGEQVVLTHIKANVGPIRSLLGI